MMSEGMFFGWSSPSLPKLLAADSPLPITADQSSWIASLLQIGSIIASMFAGKLVDTFGRKKLLHLTTVSTSISWIITGIATTHQELYAARFIAGTGLGINNVATTIYLAEVAPARFRGRAYGLIVPCIILGEFIIFVVGLLLTIRSAAWACLSVPLLLMFLIMLLPESPYFLVMKDRYKEAEKSLRHLHGTTEVKQQLRTIKMAVEMNAMNRGGLRALLTQRTNLKALGITLGVLSATQFSGCIAILFYTQQIFSSFNSSLSTKITFAPLILKFFCGFMSALLMDRTGKKPLLILSGATSGISLFIVALFLTLKSSGFDVDSYSWLPVTGICTYSAALSFGLGPICYIIVGELFALNVKAVGNNVYRCMESFYQFLVIKLYQVVSDSLGMQYPFWIFTVYITASIFFFIFAVPETKGKTLEEIQEDMQNVTVDKHKTLPLITRSAQANDTQASNQCTASC